MHVNTLLVQQVLAEPAWAKKPSDEHRCGLTALFWSNIHRHASPCIVLCSCVGASAGPVVLVEVSHPWSPSRWRIEAMVVGSMRRYAIRRRKRGGCSAA
ncbi:hypothetical protein ACFRKB_38140 [Streptomyces scopuliridis]|uniref:hypothetical protein n=1 Tax=Streptomyces scopuliridis TaxID=452529 RepID=UPI0036B4EEA1